MGAGRSRDVDGVGLLAVEGLPVTNQPYEERRDLLEQVVLEGPLVRLITSFADGQALSTWSASSGCRGCGEAAARPVQAG
jgi:hypothetical protein